MENDSNFAKRKLANASRARDAARRLSLSLATGAAALSVLLLVALLDYWLALPLTIRLGGTIVLAALIGTGLYLLAATFRNPAGIKDAALDLEAQKPELGCEISTAAEYLADERKPGREYEAELAEALETKAAARLRRAQVPYWNRPLRPAVAMAGLAFAALIFSLAASGGFTAIRRAALPWSNAAYTHLEVEPGDLEIPIGRDVEIKTRVTGRLPKETRFEWQTEGDPKWQAAVLDRSPSGEFHRELKSVQTSFRYRISGGDAVSRDFAVETFIPPAVKEFEAELKYPVYTGRSNAVQQSQDIEIVRGSAARIRITPTAKLASARIRFDKLPPLVLAPDASGSWAAALTISSNTDYWIELADAKGRRGGNTEPYHIKALPDLAPKVEMLDPSQDLRADATNTIPVQISAADDFGVEEVRLVYHRLGGPEQFVTATRAGTDSVYRTELPLSTLGLKENELVAFHAEARDNNTLDGPGIGKSEVYFVEITHEPGSACKSQSKGPSVNLLVIQKQIVADTTALAAHAPSTNFADLAQRQADAIDFAGIYAEEAAESDEGAGAELAAAVTEMKAAKAALEKNSRDEAVPSAERALAHLYQVAKMMPEVKNLPTTPKAAQENPKLKVVLNKIRKRREQQNPDARQLADALKEAEQIRDEQASLMIGAQNSGNAPGSGETKLSRAGDPSQNPNARGNGKGEGKNAVKPGKEKEGEQKDGLARHEDALSKQAAELSEKIARAAGKGSRMGRGAAQKMADASGKMREAARSARSGQMQSAGTKGTEARDALDAAVALLQQTLMSRPELADVSKEDAPKAYETAIAEYLRKLSYEE